MGQNHPPVEFLISSSNNSLEAFELARLNHASNLRKEMRQIVDEWVEAEVDSRVARWILECRRTDCGGSRSPLASTIESAQFRQLALGLSLKPPETIPVPELKGDVCAQDETASSSQAEKRADEFHGTPEDATQATPQPYAPLPNESSVPDDASLSHDFPHPSFRTRANQPPAPTENAGGCPGPDGNLEYSEDATLRSLFDFDYPPSAIEVQPSDWKISFEVDTTNPALREPRNRKLADLHWPRAGSDAPKDSGAGWPGPKPRPARQTHDSLQPPLAYTIAEVPAG